MTRKNLPGDDAYNPEASAETVARKNFVTANVVTWNTQRQFGFVMVDGKKVFIHASSILPHTKKALDYSGTKLVVERSSISTDPETRKTEVGQAYTEAYFQKAEQHLIENIQREIDDNRKRMKDQMEFLSHVPAVQHMLDDVDITQYLYQYREFEGVSVSLNKERSELKELDEKDGPTVEFTYEFMCSKGAQNIMLTTKRLVHGWKWAEVSKNPGQIVPDPHTKLVNVAFVLKGMLKGMKHYHGNLPTLRFSPTCTPPRIADQRIVQTLRMNTPLGLIEHDIVLYANPNLNWDVFCAPWNGEDIQELKKEVDARAPSKETHEREIKRHAAITDVRDDGLVLDVFPDQETIQVAWEAIRSYVVRQRMAHIGEYSYMVAGDDGFIDIRDWGHIRLINFEAGKKSSDYHDYFERYGAGKLPTFAQALSTIHEHCDTRWNTEKEMEEKQKAEKERVEKEEAEKEEKERMDAEKKHASPTPGNADELATAALSDGAATASDTGLPELQPLSDMDEVSILEEYERNDAEIATLTAKHPTLQDLIRELDEVLSERESIANEITRRRNEVPKKSYPEGNRLGDLNKKAYSLFDRMNDITRTLEPLTAQRMRLQQLMKRQEEIQRL